MLRKLMKHEFRATARLMLPLYLAALVLALLSRLGDLATQHVPAVGVDILDLLYGIITVGFAAALIAVPVVAFILMIHRFRSNLLADEGYVMFTLPVSTHQLVWSKLLVSLVWFVGAVVVDCLAVIVLAADRAFFRNFREILSNVLNNLTQPDQALLGHAVGYTAEFILLCLVGCILCCLIFYAPLAIGHSFDRRKMLLSVVFFFVIQVAMEIITVGGANLLFPLVNGVTVSPVLSIHAGLWGLILCAAVFAGVLYCITIRMLHRHLNLE
ncbi:MAG: hypothetical protein ACI3VS_04295 [Evtepia sp.]